MSWSCFSLCRLRFKIIFGCGFSGSRVSGSRCSCSHWVWFEGLAVCGILEVRVSFVKVLVFYLLLSWYMVWEILWSGILGQTWHWSSDSSLLTFLWGGICWNRNFQFFLFSWRKIDRNLRNYWIKNLLWLIVLGWSRNSWRISFRFWTLVICLFLNFLFLKMYWLNSPIRFSTLLFRTLSFILIF